MGNKHETHAIAIPPATNGDQHEQQRQQLQQVQPQQVVELSSDVNSNNEIDPHLSSVDTQCTQQLQLCWRRSPWGTFHTSVHPLHTIQVHTWCTPAQVQRRAEQSANQGMPDQTLEPCLA